MNRLSVMVDSGDFLKNKNSDTKKVHSGSLSDLSQVEPKSSGPSINREDSVLSKNSLTSIFSKKSSEGSWSNGSISSNCFPRPEKTMLLFDKVMQTLNVMYEKYCQLTMVDDGIEHQDYNEICTKIDDRMRLIQTFKTHYLSLLESKKEEYDKIQQNFRKLLSNKNNKQTLDLVESDCYWSICRELVLIEYKLEKCSGKLQFQIMDLDSISRLNPMDLYELSIKLNETTKFKTKIRIEKNGHQLWDMRNFDIFPTIDDSANIKFSELKALNKSLVLLDLKLPFINDLIKSSPSIFNCWLTTMGTIKLNVIVQWNPQLEDLGLQALLNSMDSKSFDYSTKGEVVMRSRASSHKYKLSTNIESLFRSSRSENTINSNLMSNILEDNEDEKKLKESIEKSSNEIKPSEIQSPKTEVENERKPIENPEQSVKIKILANDESLTTSVSLDEKPKTVLLRQKKIDISVNDETNNISKEEILVQEDSAQTNDSKKNNSKNGDSEEIIESIDPPVVVTSSEEQQPVVENEMEKEKNEVVSCIEDNNLNGAANESIILSPIITVSSELAIDNGKSDETETSEVIIDDNYIVENESITTNENSPENVINNNGNNNEIEVEINIDSSEVESIEQSIDDPIIIKSINNEEEENCNIDCLSSPDRSNIESDNNTNTNTREEEEEDTEESRKNADDDVIIRQPISPSSPDVTADYSHIVVVPDSVVPSSPGGGDDDVFHHNQ